MARRRALRIVSGIAGGLAALLILWIGIAFIVYPNEYVKRVLLWRESDVSDYRHNFPQRALNAADEPFRFSSNVTLESVGAVLRDAFGTEQLDSFLTDTDTQALVVIKDDAIVFEGYFNGTSRDSELTSFSVAKSFVSTLVGIAIDDGFIGSLDDPVTDYLPELAERDPGFEAITVRHLLMMSSGLAYSEWRWFLFNGDDPLTTYHPDQRQLSLENTEIAGPPGRHFSYNKYHPQLLGQIIERTTGMSVTQYTQQELWDPLGMEYPGSWSLDSTESGFEKMEAGLNARAVDFAKLGRLFLHDGDWNGTEILRPDWVALASGTDSAGLAPRFSDDHGYALFWWVWPRADGGIDYLAWGDRGQFIFVSPSNDVVIVRNGENAGIAPARWIESFVEVADNL